jgi:adenylate kinase family enzyme
MQRVLVMGSSGSGKSTFAMRLAEITSLPMVSLDALYWQPGWQPSDPDRFSDRVQQALAAGRWIVDGNYVSSGAGALRRSLADTVIWFDLPRHVCISGVINRIARGYGRVRPEMAAGCPERIDLTFIRYVWNYRREQRPKVLRYLEELRPDQSLICFTARRQGDAFLAGLLTPERPALH